MTLFPHVFAGRFFARFEIEFYGRAQKPATLSSLWLSIRLQFYDNKIER